MNTSKQINAMIVLLSLLLVGVGIYTIWDPIRAEDESERTAEVIAERAGNTFAANCRQCHGNQGEGRIGPALNPEGRKAAGLDDWTDPAKRAQYVQLVKNTLVCGRIGKIMPPWSQEQGGPFSDEQIRQLVILITENPGNGVGWEAAAHHSEELNAQAPLPEVTEVLKGAAITGANLPVCGQKAETAPTATPTPPPVATNVTVVATDNKFDLAAIAVPSGQQVTLAFQNRGAATHNWHVQRVQSTAGGEPQTKLLPGGQSETLTFTITQTGTFTYICDVHPIDMKGTLFVQ